MNLKRHHVLYSLLAVSLMIATLVFLIPSVPKSPIDLTEKPISQEDGAPVTEGSPIPQMEFEIVTSEGAKARGLSGRSEIPENYGMLFVFDTPAKHGFWMKDMLASIDIIWLSNEGVVLDIEDSVSPDTYPKGFYPPSPVKYVLETKEGESRRRGWEVGTQIQLPLP